MHQYHVPDGGGSNKKHRSGLRLFLTAGSYTGEGSLHLLLYNSLLPLPPDWLQRSAYNRRLLTFSKPGAPREEASYLRSYEDSSLLR